VFKSVKRVERVLPAVLAAAMLSLVVTPCAQAGDGGRSAFTPTGRHWQPFDSHAPASATGTGAPRVASSSYMLWDADATGAVTLEFAEPSIVVRGLDRAGATRWSFTGADAWAAFGDLPTALVAEYDATLEGGAFGSGHLVAYGADGAERFSKSFTNKGVEPLCTTARRLVWVETSTANVVRVFVRQGTRTHVLRLPTVGSVIATGSSASGARLLVGVWPKGSEQPIHPSYWIAVGKGGQPKVVSRVVTDWVYTAMNPAGTRTATMSWRQLPNRWVRFGRSHGRYLRGEDSGEIVVGDERIMVQGGFSYESDTTSWSGYNAQVIDSRYMMPLWQMSFTTSVWFRTDPDIRYLAEVDSASGEMTVYNSDLWTSATLPGPYADAAPVAGDEIVTLSAEGTPSWIADPAAGP
jgi:hypothetical protein